MKKNIALILAASMAFGVSACGNTQDTSIQKVEIDEKEESKEEKEDAIIIPEYSIVRSEEGQDSDENKYMQYFIVYQNDLSSSDKENIFKDITKDDTTYSYHVVYFYKNEEIALNDIDKSKYIFKTDDNSDMDFLHHNDNPNIDKNGEVIPEETKITKKLMSIVNENYSDTSLFNIDVNENLGTDDENDYIVLAYPKWNVKNTASTTKEMLSMYSSDLAARVGSDLSNVSEITIFWTVPYYSETETVLKYTYTRNGSKMFLTDTMVSDLLN